MGVGNYVANLFKHTPLPPVGGRVGLAVGDTAVVKSSVFEGADSPTYNPDDLIERKGGLIYKKMMLDEQVKAVTRFRRDATTGRDWAFEIGADMDSVEKDMRIALSEFTVERMQGSWKSRLDVFMSSMTFGFSVTEKNFEQIEFENKMWWGIHSLRSKPFDSFYFYLNEFGSLVKFEQQLDDVVLDLDYTKFIHHVHNADVDEWYGQSELREAYRPYFSKEMAIRHWNIFLERYGSGFIWAQPTGGKQLKKGTVEHTDLKSALASVRTSTSMILGPDLDLNIAQFRSTDSYERAIIQHDKAISKALLMPNLLGLSEQGKNGSRALGQTQLEAFLWILNAEAKSLEETINEQLFKELGQVNFSDGVYPRFRFKPLSSSEKDKLIEQWKTLVQSGAVENTEADEAHVRQLLNFPEKPEREDTESIAVNPQTALNGAQIESLINVINQVALGAIPRETGLNIIVTAFPVSPDGAEAIMGEVGRGFVPAQGGRAEDADEGSGHEDENGEDVSDAQDEEEGSSHGDKNKFPTEHDDETLGAGATLLQIAFTKALKRVDFKTIRSVSNEISEGGAKELSAIMADALKKIATQIKDADLNDIAVVKQIKFPVDNKRALNKESKKIINKAWRLGNRQATKEIERAKKEKFSRGIAFTLEKQAAKYFDSTAFKMAGNISDVANKLIQNEISQGVKNNKSTAEVVESIYKRFSSDGLIDLETVEALLGEALDITNPRHRLETTIKTTTFEAINESRFAFFNSDDLDGFVEAFEYSAIIDSRVTPICAHLDGRIFSNDSEEWGTYRPPNHFNCRSLMIPVTQQDVWEASESPSLNPQEGFS